MQSKFYPVNNNFSTVSFQNMDERVQKACDWLHCIGFASPLSRISKYAKSMEEVSKYHRLGMFEEMDEIDFSEFVNNVMEMEELCKIYNGLSDVVKGDIEEKIKMFVSGHHLRKKCKASEHSRNIAFELYMMSMVLNSGMDLDFTSLADVRTSFKGYDVFCECKRIKSIKQIKKRVKDGFKQLKSRFSRADYPNMSRGILCLSIGDIYS